MSEHASTDCAQLHAQVPATHPLGQVATRSDEPPQQPADDHQSRARTVQDVHLPRDSVHCGDRLPKPIGEIEQSMIQQNYNKIYFLSKQITKLKIDSNPFAKGFRDSSRLTDLERYEM